jgi:hypothetical protein
MNGPIVNFADGAGEAPVFNWDLCKVFAVGACVRDDVHHLEGLVQEVNGASAIVAVLGSSGLEVSVTLFF